MARAQATLHHRHTAARTHWPFARALPALARPRALLTCHYATINSSALVIALCPSCAHSLLEGFRQLINPSLFFFFSFFFPSSLPRGFGLGPGGRRRRRLLGRAWLLLHFGAAAKAGTATAVTANNCYRDVGTTAEQAPSHLLRRLLDIIQDLTGLDKTRPDKTRPDQTSQDQHKTTQDDTMIPSYANYAMACRLLLPSPVAED